MKDTRKQQATKKPKKPRGRPVTGCLIVTTLKLSQEHIDLIETAAKLSYLDRSAFIRTRCLLAAKTVIATNALTEEKTK